MGLLKFYDNSRKKVFFSITFISMILWLLNCLTKVNIEIGITIRAFLGIVSGAFSAINTAYLIEIAPEGKSGLFGTLSQLGVCLGMILFDFLGAPLTYIQLNYIGSLIDFIIILFAWFIEESPYVTILNNEETDSTKEKSENKESILQKKYIFGLFFCILIMFFQQFSGINAFLSNLADIMNESGFKLNGNYQGGIASCAQIITVSIAALIMDKIGRKITWIVSCFLITFFLAIYALNVIYKWSDVLPMCCVFGYQLAFGLGLGPIPWFIIPEYFTGDARSKASTIAAASNSLFSFLTIEIFPTMEIKLGLFWSLIIYASVSLMALFFGLFTVHEPKSNYGTKIGDDEENKKLIFNSIKYYIA